MLRLSSFSFRMLPVPADASRRLLDAFEIGLKACQHVHHPTTSSVHVFMCPQVRTKLPRDGNAAAFFKVVGELGIHAGDLPRGRELFAEAAPLFAQVRRLQARYRVGCAHGFGLRLWFSVFTVYEAFCCRKNRSIVRTS